MGLTLACVDFEQAPGNPELFDIPPASVVGSGMEKFDRPLGISNPAPSGFAFGGTPLGMPANLVQISGSQNTFGVQNPIAGFNVVVQPLFVGPSSPVVAQGSFPSPSTPGTYTFHLMNGRANVLDVREPLSTPPEDWPVSKADVQLDAFSFVVEEVTCTRGDVNDDDLVDGRDIQPYASVLLDPGASPQQRCAADVNEDAAIGYDDLVFSVATLWAG